MVQELNPKLRSLHQLQGVNIHNVITKVTINNTDNIVNLRNSLCVPAKLLDIIIHVGIHVALAFMRFAQLYNLSQCG